MELEWMRRRGAGEWEGSFSLRPEYTAVSGYRRSQAIGDPIGRPARTRYPDVAEDEVDVRIAAGAKQADDPRLTDHRLAGLERKFESISTRLQIERESPGAVRGASLPLAGFEVDDVDNPAFDVRHVLGASNGAANGPSSRCLSRNRVDRRDTPPARVQSEHHYDQPDRQPSEACPAGLPDTTNGARSLVHVGSVCKCIARFSGIQTGEIPRGSGDGISAV